MFLSVLASRHKLELHQRVYEDPGLRAYLQRSTDSHGRWAALIRFQLRSGAPSYESTTADIGTAPATTKRIAYAQPASSQTALIPCSSYHCIALHISCARQLCAQRLPPCQQHRLHLRRSLTIRLSVSSCGVTSSQTQRRSLWQWTSSCVRSRPESESESDYIFSSHIRLIRCLTVIGQASRTRKHLV